MLDLDTRKQEILKAVIHAYIHDAEPVGSERIAHRLRLHVSPATIRNEMAALEELGFLSHPHTSAGRVPTDHGYRFYVDTLVQQEPSAQERTRLRRFLAGGDEPGHIAEEVARALAVVTEYASVVTAPAPERQLFQHLRFIPLTSTKVIAVIVTDAGMVQGRAFDVQDPLEPGALDRLSRMVSQRLQGYALAEITEDLLAEMVDQAAWQHRILVEMLRWLRHRAPVPADRRVYIDGTANILKQPEFHDARTAQPVLSALEREEVLSDLLEVALGRQVWVTIGSEHRHEDLRGTTVVAAPYQMGGRPAGALGIVGPTRMKYGKVISLVRYLAGSLSEILTESP